MQPSSPDDQPNVDRPGTPPRPPYSPVTPVLSHLAPVPNNADNNDDDNFPAPSGPFSASHPIVPPRSPSPTSRIGIALPSQAALPGLNLNLNANAPVPIPVSAPASIPASTPTQQLPPASFVPEPAPVPISESENPDAIALRSAISILQMQKQQSLRDIRTLERLKKAAAADPQAFARELAAGKLAARDAGGFVNFTHEGDDDDDDDDDGEGGGDGDEDAGREGVRSCAGLGTIPTPQNVVRMPPVNWAKYQIVGDPLDRMHEDQRRRPSSGEPRRDESTQRAPEHVLASPYRPLVDKLETPGKVKGASKSKKT